MRAWARVSRVDDDGILVHTLDDRPVDVCIDGRRVWTFWTRRDTERRRGLARWAPWPRPLAKHLDGRCRLELRDSATGVAFFDQQVSLGEGEGVIEVRNADGVELGMDKSGKLVPTFSGRSPAEIDGLLDATEAVLAALAGVGLEPFLAYGTLLGAVREGRLIGHDSDADLGYVSKFSSPFDVARESFRVQRELNRQGWRTSRYSGAAFKVDVVKGSATIGLDVFGGFIDHGRLHLMGEIGTEFRDEWIRPLGAATLEGRSLPVPAQPERLLEAMYGPGWRSPDPAFKFETPPRTVRALEDWFRGTQPGLRLWQRRATVSGPQGATRGPSPLARRAAVAAHEAGAQVLDIGAGRGSDSLWLARQGLSVLAYDYAPLGLRHAEEQARLEGLDLEVRQLNLTELRSVLVEVAGLAHDPRPRVVLARHVIDATSPLGRESLARLASVALRGGGSLFAELHVRPRPDVSVPEPPAWQMGEPDVDEVSALLRSAGARSLRVRRLDRRGRPTVRMVGEW